MEALVFRASACCIDLLLTRMGDTLKSEKGQSRKTDPFLNVEYKHPIIVIVLQPNVIA